MTNQLTGELVFWDLAEKPDGAEPTEDRGDEPVESQAE